MSWPSTTDQTRATPVSLAETWSGFSSRIICVAEHYDEDIPLAQAFANKWLSDVCLYCGHAPCVCASEQRPDPQSVVSDRAGWSFSQIAQHLQMLYGDVNATQPIEYLILRLTEECGETSSAVIRSTRTDSDPETILYEIAKELADGIAWVFSIANRIGVDVQAEYLLRYGNGCRTCDKPVCECTEFDFNLRAATAV